MLSAATTCMATESVVDNSLLLCYCIRVETLYRTLNMVISKKRLNTQMIDWLKNLFKVKTCKHDGCGYLQPNVHDHKCAICRLPMGE
jgi:hypothetical protein